MPDHAPPSKDPFAPRMPHEPKERQCLRCKAAFESTWSGERICRRCKGTTAWRNGGPPTTHPSSGRR